MPEFDMPEPKRLMIAGDWHSNGRFAKLAIKYAESNLVDAILQLGDFGYWPEFDDTHGPFWCAVHKAAEDAGIPVYWIDGNHENHDALVPGVGDQWLRHLPRGHRWQWWDKTWMAVGGGVSVDKKFRTAGHDWFPEETIQPQQFEHCIRDGKVDIIVSHDCPEGVLIPGVHALQKQGKEPDGSILTEPWFPVEQLHESEAHRGVLGSIVAETQAKLLFHGHYHQRYEVRAKSGFGVGVVGMGMDGGPMSDNVLILTKEQLPK